MYKLGYVAGECKYSAVSSLFCWSDKNWDSFWGNDCFECIYYMWNDGGFTGGRLACLTIGWGAY